MPLKEYSRPTKDIKLLKLACLACLKHLARAGNWNCSKNIQVYCSVDYVCHYSMLLWCKGAVGIQKEVY